MTSGAPRLAARGVYAITPPELRGQVLLDRVAAALRGGVTLVQYRAKTTANLHDAQAITQLCHHHGALCIVNDDPELALAAGADGVHLGVNDPDIRTVRKTLGIRRIVGVSCYDRLDLAVLGVAAGADYVAFGSFFPSPTKPDAVRTALMLLSQARARVSVPIVAIGGISPDNGQSVVNHGADWLAVGSAIFTAENPESTARACARLIRAHAI